MQHYLSYIPEKFILEITYISKVMPKTARGPVIMEHRVYDLLASVFFAQFFFIHHSFSYH